MLSGRFPETPLFSHDSIEGARVRAGLANDIQHGIFVLSAANISPKNT
jgi:hypothetical protein